MGTKRELKEATDSMTSGKIPSVDILGAVIYGNGYEQQRLRKIVICLQIRSV